MVSPSSFSVSSSARILIQSVVCPVANRRLSDDDDDHARNSDRVAPFPGVSVKRNVDWAFLGCLCQGDRDLDGVALFDHVGRGVQRHLDLA